MKIPTAEEVSQCEADAAAYRARLIELLEVHEYIDNEDQHQTKMTKEVLSRPSGARIVDSLNELRAACMMMYDTLRELKVRIAFIGMPQEPFWMDGDRKIWDWRKQCALLEQALDVECGKHSFEQLQYLRAELNEVKRLREKDRHEASERALKSVYELEKYKAAMANPDPDMADRLTVWSHTCIHHNDAERKKALSVCLVCLLRERDSALAACAAKDEALQKSKGRYHSCDGASCVFCDSIDKALALTCGEGWVSPEEHGNLSNHAKHLEAQNAKLEAEVSVMREGLQRIATSWPINDEPLARHKCEQAVEILCSTTAGKSLIAELQSLREALEFYADPANYHAIAITPDPPCGAFIEDFSYDAAYQRAMPGKLAREVLQQKGEKIVSVEQYELERLRKTVRWLQNRLPQGAWSMPAEVSQTLAECAQQKGEAKP